MGPQINFRLATIRPEPPSEEKQTCLPDYRKFLTNMMLDSSNSVST
jgi:hypothetical protein